MRPSLVVRALSTRWWSRAPHPAAAPVLAGDPPSPPGGGPTDRQALAAVRAEMDAVQAEIGALAEQMRAIAAHEADLRTGLAALAPGVSASPAAGPGRRGTSRAPGSGGGREPRPPAPRRDRVAVYDLPRAATTSRGRLLALGDQEAILAEDLARRSTFEPTAVAAASSGRAAPGPGEAVAAGDTRVELLDCERRFLGCRCRATCSSGYVRATGVGPAQGRRSHRRGGGGDWRRRRPVDGGSLRVPPAGDRPSSVQVRIRLAPANPAMPEVAATSATWADRRGALRARPAGGARPDRPGGARRRGMDLGIAARTAGPAHLFPRTPGCSDERHGGDAAALHRPCDTRDRGAARWLARPWGQAALVAVLAAIVARYLWWRFTHAAGPSRAGRPRPPSSGCCS
jgi:hypothetical protein